LPPCSGSDAYPVLFPGDIVRFYATLWADESRVFPNGARTGPRTSTRSACPGGVEGATNKGDLMAKTAKKKTTRKANAAFMKPMTPSKDLAAVIGDKPMPRTEVTKKLWAYIKKNGLQDSKNKRNINADDKLKPVFGGKKTVSMFEMTKLVSKHLK
jgi:chromatin remodeling complex protein RSC6